MDSSRLFRTLSLGSVTLCHRIALAPLTRFRTDSANVPLPFVAEYYGQRACEPGTLLISEVIAVSPRMNGYAHSPEISSPNQGAAWRRVTQAVHAQGSFIFAQLWAAGRAAMVADMLTRHGFELVGPSVLPVDGHAARMSMKPRPLTGEEVKEIVEEFARAARDAVAAGFDGVEVLGANGYLIDQFLHEGVNVREDEWGGTVEKRAKFAIEVARAVVDAVGRERVGFRLSPWGSWQGMHLQDPVPQFRHTVEELRKLNIAYLHPVEPRYSGDEDVETLHTVKWAIDAWIADGNQKPIILSGGFTFDLAKQCVDEEYAHVNILIAFGRYFTSNPDLVFRLRNGVALDKYNRDSFYTVGAEAGYSDYAYSPGFLSPREAK